jgi:hypothetical protein
LSANTVWEARAGRFIFSRDEDPSTGTVATPSRFDRITGVTSGNPPRFGSLRIARTTAKATVIRYQPGLLGANHEWKAGAQVEQGEHQSLGFIPSGVRYVDSAGEPFQAIFAAPSRIGGASSTVGAFATDAMTFGERLTVNAGVRFDHSRAISQDLDGVTLTAAESGETVPGRGTLYTWNSFSPRLGVTAKLDAVGRTILRASYGRFRQGVLTGELEFFHPGATPTTTRGFDAATGSYSRLVSTVDPRINLQIDPGTRGPYTDEYSIGVDREVGRQTAVAVAYVRKDGSDFIGWTDVGGQYRDETRVLPDGRSVPVSVLVNPPSARRFLLTNPDGYSLAYDGLVMTVDKRRARGWQASGSYTLSRARGLQPSSGANAAGGQTSTVSPPQPLTFGRDPNDLTNAQGRLPNDRPHIFRARGSLDLPRTGVSVAGHLQHFSGKPWAATAQIQLPQGDLRVLLEPRGSRRLPSQSLLDLRVSRTFRLGGVTRVDLLLDVLNALNDTAEEGLASDTLISPNFGRPNVFVDPRRAMLGLRVHLGRNQ